MSKRTYRATPVKKLDLEALAVEFANEKLTVGVDVAKAEMFAVLRSADTILLQFRWDHLSETGRVAKWQRQGAFVGPGHVTAQRPSTSTRTKRTRR